MRTELICQLADCSEFRQTLLARPPQVVHGAAILATVLLSTAVVWSALTEADVVVRAGGLVRPVTAPQKVAALAGGRVTEVHVRQGQEVRAGDLLVKLDTEQQDTETRKQQQAIRTGEQELAGLARLREAAVGQFEAVRSEAEARLAQIEEEIRTARQRQSADVLVGEAQLKAAQDDEARAREAVRRGVESSGKAIAAAERVRELQAQLEKLRVPLESAREETARRALATLERDHQKGRAELDLRIATREGDLAAARIALDDLRREREKSFLRSPVAGVVTSEDVKVGDVLRAGEAVLTIAEQRGFLYEVEIPSEDCGRLRAGMAAKIKLDAYDYQRYGTLAGTVRSISPDSHVLEGLRTATYTVRIELAGDELGRGDDHGRVRLGMAGQAEIVTARVSLLVLLAKQIRQTISLG
jgi:multidrug resistance efflux pump